MTIARNLLVASLAVAAAAPLLAQKPGAEIDPVRERYRVQGVALCVADLNAAQGVGPDDSEAVCGCAFTRFMPRWPTGALPPLGEGRLRTAVGGDLVACAAGEDAALAAAVARHLAVSPNLAPSPVAAAPPVAAPDEGGKPVDGSDEAAAAPDRREFDFRAWVDGLLPGWLTNSGLPLWALIPLIVFVFLFLRGLMRRGDGKDLIGPPRSLDPSTRRPDLPPPRL
jgi:hypothetical protein